MLKQSLLTAGILGALVAVAQSGEMSERAQRFQKSQTEFRLEAEPAACAAKPGETRKASSNFDAQQDASPLELGYRPRYCWLTKFGLICF